LSVSGPQYAQILHPSFDDGLSKEGHRGIERRSQGSICSRQLTQVSGSV